MDKLADHLRPNSTVENQQDDLLQSEANLNYDHRGLISTENFIPNYHSSIHQQRLCESQSLPVINTPPYNESYAPHSSSDVTYLSLTNSYSDINSVKTETINECQVFSGLSKFMPYNEFHQSETIVKPLPDNIHEVTKESEKNCLVCQDNIKLDFKDWKDCFTDFTTTSFTLVCDALNNIINEKSANIKLRKMTVICGSCFSLLDQADELEVQVNEVKKQLTVSYIIFID